MAESVGLSVEEFLRRYAHTVHGRLTLNEVSTKRGYDCVFLRIDSNNGKALCSIYESRPQQCRSWPFWPENLRGSSAWRAAAKTCPGMQAGLKGEGQFYPVDQIRIIRDSTPPI